MSIFTKIDTVKGHKAIPALSAGDEARLLNNPDRGFRHEIAFHFKDIDKAKPGELTDEFYEEIERHADYYAAEHPTLAQVYVYLTAYNKTEKLPQSVFERLDLIFEALRGQKIRALLRFAYQFKMDGSDEEASEKIMCAHMEQLFPEVAKNLDVIHVYQAGFLGAWGEWHGYALPTDQKRMITKIMETCPPELFVQVRVPQFKNHVSDDMPYKSRISHHNDSVFGEDHTATGGVNPGAELERQIERESPFLPIDGELFWGRWSASADGFFPDPYKVLYWVYDHRYTSLSIRHNYVENGVDKPYAMAKWKNIELTPDFLHENGMICDPDYFTDKRSVFEYLRDHLGYRIKATILDIAEVDGGISVRMDAVNYGFAAPHMLVNAGFALLDMDGNIVSEVPCEPISGWQPRAVTGRSDALTHRASATLSADKGTYYLAFYMRNNADTPARLCNDIIYENGYNILGKVTL